MAGITIGAGGKTVSYRRVSWTHEALPGRMGEQDKHWGSRKLGLTQKAKMLVALVKVVSKVVMSRD